MANDFPQSIYPYDPSKAAPILFAVFFLISTIIHTHQTLKTKSWRFTVLLPWAGIIFVAGFAVREVSVYQPDDLGLYIATVVLLYIAPPAYAAANYFILARVLHYLPTHSPVHPTRLITTFLALDVAVEVLTGQGASRLSNPSNEDNFRAGIAIIKASLILQLVLFLAFVAVIIVFFDRCRRAGVLSGKVRLVLVAMLVSSALITVRNIYRVVENFEGPDGYVMTREAFLYVFDGLLMLGNAVLWNILYPARLLPQDPRIFLSKDGVTERRGPGWEDRRRWYCYIIDPFDIGRLFEKHGNGIQYWDREDEWPVVNYNDEAGRRNYERA